MDVKTFTPRRRAAATSEMRTRDIMAEHRRVTESQSRYLLLDIK